MEQPTPIEARRILTEIPDPKDSATTRVVGLTWMVWGLAFAVGLLATGALMPDDLLFQFANDDGSTTAYPFEEQMFWFVLGMALPVAVAAFITTQIWQSKGVLPEGRPGLMLTLFGLGTLIGGYLLLWVVGFVMLVADELLYAAGLWSPGFSFRGGVGTVLAVAVWAALFGLTKWNQPVQSRKVGLLLGGVLAVAVIPLGMLADVGGHWESVSLVLGAFAVMVGYCGLGAALYARG